MSVFLLSLQAQQSTSGTRNSTLLILYLFFSTIAHLLLAPQGTRKRHPKPVSHPRSPLPHPPLYTYLPLSVHHRFGGGDLVDYSVNFAVTQNPNGHSVGPTWPQWTASSPTNLAFLDGLFPRVLEADTYRQAGMDLLNSLALLYPI